MIMIPHGCNIKIDMKRKVSANWLAHIKFPMHIRYNDQHFTNDKSGVTKSEVWKGY